MTSELDVLLEDNVRGDTIVTKRNSLNTDTFREPKTQKPLLLAKFLKIRYI